MGSRRVGGEVGGRRWGICASLPTTLSPLPRLRFALQTHPGQLPHQPEKVLQERLW